MFDETIHTIGTPNARTLRQRTGGAPRGTILTPLATRMLAVTRIALGFVFLWAFLDKTFGWHYATPAGKGWVDGGSPTSGFLSGVHVGPFAPTLRSWAGEPWAD